ncbi:MAG: polysaccharide deacetylase family protein [Lachnospiraceae bacterium]|nr:polysaccharide deacetylase family protein [Lachnospiraceae bacterium]
MWKKIAIVTLLLSICLCAVVGSRKGKAEEVSNMYGDRKLPIYCVETEEKIVALSFDAAWGNEDTEEILDILERQDVKVTFFMTGGWVESYPQDVKQIYEHGHELGNHSENHLNMSELSMAEIEEEIMLVHNRVKEITGYDMKVFRPPYGDYDNDVITGVENCGYYAVQWSVDSLDWKNYGVDSIIQTVTCHKNLDCGAIILCHNGAKYTADALEEMIVKLKEQGYSFVKMSDLIYKENYRMDVTGQQCPCDD